MKNRFHAVVGFLPALFLLAGISVVSAARDISGHWEGAIKLPGTSLGIRVDLEQDEGQWSGTIDIPVQGLRGFKLGGLVVGESEILFSMPNIPGEPKFSGSVASDERSITGDFLQSGQTFEFHLERKGDKAPPREGETPAKGIPGEGFAAVWQGSLRVSVVELRLVLKLEKSESGDLSGTMDSIDQNAKDIPISKASENGRVLRLEVSRIGGAYDGELSDDGSEIVGEWAQGGQRMALVLKRIEKAPDLKRPQDPKKPYPYNEEDVRFENKEAGIELEGTLTFPKTNGPHPSVVLLTGSGPQNRDEAIMGHRPFLVLADHLTRHGIAVLRFDDRGVGESDGDFGDATNLDFTSDALAAVAYIKSREELDPKRIGLIGHSEGGITAPRAAVQSSDVAFIVLMAGVGVPMEELLQQQGQDIARVMGADGEALEKQTGLQREIFKIAREKGGGSEAEAEIRRVLGEITSELTPEQRKATGVSGAFVESQVKMVLSPWFREILAYDPRPILEKVKCPVLAINGEKDLQVAAKPNLEAIRAAISEGGNLDVETVEFPDLNHLFQKCDTGAIAEYGQIEETINPVALKTISDWLREKTGL